MENMTFDTQFITLDTLKDKGFSYYKIDKLVNEGNLKKINRNTYENVNYKGDYNDFYIANAYVPDGVICEFSAADHYGLINYVPPYIHVAIDRDKKISTLPEWPSVSLRYYSKKRINFGVVEINEDGNKYKIFDVEKTVIDMLSFRNKLPIDEVMFALKNYLNRKDRNLNKLYRYSKEFRCEKILRTYMEALL